MKIFSLTFLIFGFATSLLSAQTVIDTFDDPDPTLLIQPTAGTSSRVFIGAGILGGMRDDTVTAQAQAVLGNNTNGFFALAQAASDQVSGALLYNDFAPGLDLTTGQSSLFSVDFITLDPGPSLTDVLSISVTSGGNSVSSFLTVPAGDAAGQPIGNSTATVDFASFTGIDFTSVDAISLEFDFASAPGRDFSIDNFIATAAAVPEPSSVGLCCLVVGGVFLRRRRNG